MKNDSVYGFKFPILLSIGLLFFLLLFSQWSRISENFDDKWNAVIVNQSAHLQHLKEAEPQQKGAHVFGYIDSTNLQPFIRNNFNWITLVSYGDQKDFDSPIMNYYRGDSLQMIRRDSVWKNQIALAHSSGFKVFLKPHIWLYAPSDGKWRSDIFPANEENWKLWQKNYREFILLYAKLAQENNVELFCIGTELSRLSVEKSDFWKGLIREVRSIYSGKITYAANWYNEYEKINFWEDLDYIGIQAYFPLVKHENPTVAQIAKGWEKYLPEIESMYKKHHRKILFTEMGYKSTTDSAIEPWQWIENDSENKRSLSFETQANCYEAFFNTVWKKEWFAGVHIWQMRSDDRGDGYKRDLDFTPQGKPAEMVIAKGFE